MRRLFFLSAVLYLNIASCWALFEEVTTDAKSFARSGVWSSGREGWDADLSSPAILHRSLGWGLRAGFALPFGMADLGAISSAGQLSSGRLNLGLGLNIMGCELYRESRARAVAAYNYHEMIAAGVAVNVFHLAIQNYGSAATVGMDGGLTVSPERRFSLGFVIKNINQPAVVLTSGELARELTIGVDYYPIPRASSALGIRMQRGWPSQLRVGQEFWIMPQLAMRFGYQNRPGAVSGGFGLSFLDYSLDYAVRTHPELGLSHCLSLGYSQMEGRVAKEIVIPKRDERARRISLNFATQQELCLLPGVGTKKASSIIAYRDSVGGFSYLDDLLAIKGITERWLMRIAPYVDLDFRPRVSGEVFPLNINRATAAELCRLPGIGPKMAREIVNYRQQHGRFQRPEDLMKVRGIGRKTFERIRNLITVEEAGPAE